MKLILISLASLTLGTSVILTTSTMNNTVKLSKKPITKLKNDKKSFGNSIKFVNGLGFVITIKRETYIEQILAWVGDALIGKITQNQLLTKISDLLPNWFLEHYDS